MRTVGVFVGAFAVMMSAVPAQASEEWGRQGRWMYLIDTGCTMSSLGSDKAKASIKLQAIGDELLVTLSDDSWPRDALRAMNEGQKYRATMSVDQGPAAVVTAERDTRWGYVTLTAHSDQLQKMAAGRTLRYQVGSSPIAGQLELNLTAGALGKYRQCKAEAHKRNIEAEDEWLNGND